MAVRHKELCLTAFDIEKQKVENKMAKSAYEIQKERTRELEENASRLLDNCSVATLTSINENGYPRTCVM